MNMRKSQKLDSEQDHDANQSLYAIESVKSIQESLAMPVKSQSNFSE
jgi:hypothetical protein